MSYDPTLVDLTIPYSEDIVTVPGHPSPSLEPYRTLERDGIRSTFAQIMLHSGTHIDVPWHIVADGATVDEVPLERFFRDAIKLDLTHVEPGAQVTLGDLDRAGLDPAAVRGKILVLATGWCDGHWQDPGLFGRNPHLADEAAQALAAAAPSALAVDFSVDAGKPWPNHQTLLGADVLLLENLLRLPELPADGFKICAFPLRLVGENGSPARVVAFL